MTPMNWFLIYYKKIQPRRLKGSKDESNSVLCGFGHRGRIVTSLKDFEVNVKVQVEGV
jgi:hypothetical protein